MKKLTLILTIFLFLLINHALFPCTGFVTVNGKKILFANNEDHGNKLDTAVRIYAPSSERFGYMSVGFSSQHYSQGGVNEKGLCLDSFSVPECNWAEDPDKLNFSGATLDRILETCATVEDVITFCSTYNLNLFTANHLFAADKTGKSVIIEWGDTDIEVIPKQGDFQVITNFFILHPERGYYPCWRFDTATDMLIESYDFTWALCRSILDAVHFENSTSYSNIIELHKGTMTVFYLHNFDEFITFNIPEELSKRTNNHYKIPELMSGIKLGNPENEQQLDPAAVEFSWTGKTASTYLLYVSTNPDFSDCTPIEIKAEHSKSSFLSGGIFFLLLIPLGFPYKSKHRRYVGVLVLILIVLLSTNCNQAYEKQQEFFHFVVTVENLNTDSTYYWKLTANAIETVTTESIVRSFKTF